MENKSGITVLSLFDGMSCGQQALERAGIGVSEYYASEIDKHAIAVTMHNYPNTRQLGSVVNVDGYSLPKIDILIGGSPCQSFSFAGKRKGMSTKDSQEILTLDHYLQLKAEGYEFEGQSYLFWEFMRLLNECKPTYFLLENVEMGEKWESVLRKAIGVKALHINSALVSAQNRKRIYFTNIGMREVGLFGDLESIIQQPKDKGILLRDVLERDVPEKYYLSDKMLTWLNKHSEKRGSEFKKLDGNQKSSCLTTTEAKQNLSNDYIIVASRGRNPENPKSRKSGLETEQQLEPRKDGKTNCLTSVQKDNLVMCLTPKRTEYGKQIRKQYESGEIQAPRSDVSQLEPREDGKTNTLTTVQKDNLVMQLNPSTESNGCQPYQQNRVYDANGISPTLDTRSDQKNVFTDGKIRRLTPTECCRLQTVSDNYFKDENGKNIISDTQQYKCLGNGWTIDVIAHIFSYLPKEFFNQPTN
jgi:DNA-cytosine methyltransferase